MQTTNALLGDWVNGLEMKAPATGSLVLVYVVPDPNNWLACGAGCRCVVDVHNRLAQELLNLDEELAPLVAWLGGAGDDGADIDCNDLAAAMLNLPMDWTDQPADESLALRLLRYTLAGLKAEAGLAEVGLVGGTIEDEIPRVAAFVEGLGLTATCLSRYAFSAANFLDLEAMVEGGRLRRLAWRALGFGEEPGPLDTSLP